MTPLEQEIRAHIERSGPIPFAEFMRIALYHPDHGYYTKRVPGEDTGYATAPTLSPVFGRLVARALESMWDTLDRPHGFTVVEAGGGRGDLAAAVLSQVPFRWLFVEPHPRVEAVQRDRLGGPTVDWVRSLDEVRPVTGCLIANEVLDNFPVHVIDGGRELLVGLEDNELSLTWGEPAVTAPVADGVAELRPSVSEWVAQAAGTLERGYVIVVDYGYERAPGRSTLLAYDRGVPVADLLVRPGEVDITAHVDFGALATAGERAGLTRLGLVPQSGFLSALGLSAELDRLRAREAGASPDSLRAHSERSLASLLAAPGRLGDLKVLVMAKDAPPLAFLDEAARARPAPADTYPGYVLEVVDEPG